MTTYHALRRIAIALAGLTVVCVGVALLVLPGPGLVVIAVGLGILSVEYAWARHWLKKMKDTGSDVVEMLKNGTTTATSGDHGTGTEQTTGGETAQTDDHAHRSRREADSPPTANARQAADRPRASASSLSHRGEGP